MSMSMAYGVFDTEEAQAESLRVLDKAAEMEGIMLDTSDIYGPHTNERLISKALPGKRDKFKIATKCGIQLQADMPVKLNSSPEYVKKACQESLDRLGIDCIDLYYLHRYDQQTPVEETFKAFKEMVDEGKIKYVGVSELGISQLRKAHAICPITAYQMEWSLFERGVEEELVPTCRELGIGIVAYSPLGRGFLTGAIKSIDDIPENDFRRTVPRFSEYIEENLKLVEVVKTISEAKGCTMGQVALAWLHAQGDDVFPIPGTKRLSRFEENVGGFNVKLTDEEMKQLAEIADKIKGNRYGEQMMAATYEAQKEVV